MFRVSSIALIFYLSLSNAFADAFANFGHGAKSASMAHASVGMHGLWALHNNQAGITRLDRTTFGINYDNQFASKVLSTRSLALALPVKNIGHWGLSARYFGYELYNETLVGLAYAKSITPNFSASIQFDYLHLGLPNEYTNKQAITAEVGFIAKLNNYFTVSGHIFNPRKTTLIASQNEIVPSNIRLGLSYFISKPITWHFEVQKLTNYKPIAKTGIEYNLNDIFYLRAGIASQPLFYSFGAGVYLKGFQLDLSSSMHQVLGLSPQATLSYQF